MTLTELFTNIANAIRAKTGSTEPIIAEDFPSAIEAIPECSVFTTTTILYDDVDSYSLEIPELIGADCFILQGNPMDYSQISNLDYVNDSGIVHQLIYLNGKFIVTYCELGRGFSCGFELSDEFSFDKNTGIITIEGSICWFGPFTTDTTSDVNYTVYSLG